MFAAISIASALLFSGGPALALNNGVAKLPIMGYNTWNAYQCNINEGLVLEMAQLMKDLGLQAAGYTHVNLDDCWAEKNRTAWGQLMGDLTKFPSGMANHTANLKALGFTAGIYGDSGYSTCAGYPGGFGYEELDAATYTEWGFDYLKYDNCAIPPDDIILEGTMGKYQRMADAISLVASTLNTTPLIYSLCEWGWSQVWLWGATMSQSWRIDGDIEPYWSSLTAIINSASFITGQADFYGHNDLDMLQLGNGNLTFDEQKSHFTAWAFFKSPLLIGTNLSAIPNDTLSILLNTEIIAINQDPVVSSSVSPFSWGLNADWTYNATYPAQYYSGPSQNGTVFMLLNTLDEEATLSFNLTQSPWIRAGRQYAVRDMWSHTDNGTAVRNMSVTLPAHGVSALLLTDAGNEPAGLYPDCMVWYQCTLPNGTSVGG